MNTCDVTVHTLRRHLLANFEAFVGREIMQREFNALPFANFIDESISRTVYTSSDAEFNETLQLIEKTMAYFNFEGNIANLRKSRIIEDIEQFLFFNGRNTIKDFQNLPCISVKRLLDIFSVQNTFLSRGR
ncbi:uncharacterized protein LOC143147975 isoform X1 [Ptiloglossa arizonensis]|uniref:uncharacterized protein LOC143147975 isoform X1 n=1 Tax=Ptiloglossa arizonensis TaxID=3350558 RepID=UPI003FA0B4D8